MIESHAYQFHLVDQGENQQRQHKEQYRGCDGQLYAAAYRAIHPQKQ